MNKNKWYRSNFFKGLWLIVMPLAALAAAMALLVLLFLGDKGIQPLEKAATYEESESFGETVFDSARGILNNISGISLTEYTGLPESAAVIDLQEIMEGKEVTGRNVSGLAYSLEDLEEWSRKDWRVASSVNGDKGIIVCQRPEGSYEYFYYQDFQKLVNEKELVLVSDASRYISEEEWLQLLYNGHCPGGMGEEFRYAADKSGNVLYTGIWNYMGERLEELYKPQNAEGILEVMNKNEKWNGKLTGAFQALKDAIFRVENVNSSKDGLKRYDEGNTNLTYLYVDKEKERVYTNKKAYEDYGKYETALSEFKKGGVYAVMTPVLSDCEMNLESVNQAAVSQMGVWHQMVKDHGPSMDYIYAVTVDTEFPISDSFAQESRDYVKHRGWSRIASAAGIVSVALILIGFCWLTAIAGRKPKDEEIHLCGYDRWYTEPSALLVAFPGLCVFFAFGYHVPIGQQWLDAENMALFGVTAVSLMVLFLTGWLSLVRRIKAKVLWKNSLLRRILALLKKGAKRLGKLGSVFARNTKSKVITAVLFVGFAFFQLVLLAFIFSNGFAEMLILLFVADAAALVWLLYRADGWDRIMEGLKRISEGELQYKIPVEHLMMEQKLMAERINNIGSGLDVAVENSLKNERMKTELITNVSHDIKTPLTSIINYIDLLKRENFEDEKVCGYLDVLTEKAQRLKILTEDVVEASKATTGNISLEMAPLDFVELLQQVMGEFEEKFAEKKLAMMVHFTDEPSFIYADGRRMWRVLENIFNNVAKYAMEGTRVYAEVSRDGKKVVFSLKNISAQPLNFSADELTERFIRGDVSRNTEGSGLGLSIAKSLTELQGGEFKLYLDGDLFKVVITFEEIAVK